MISTLAKTLKKIAKEEKIGIHIEPHWGYVGVITKKNGTQTYFRGTHFDLNGMGSSEIAKDKGYSAYFLKRFGYNTIETKTFYSYDFAKLLKSKDNPTAAYNYAKTIGFPVVVKPNSLSQGRLVCVCQNKKTFTEAVNKISKIDKVFLVQPLVYGHDFRILILDGEVISAYERTPFGIVGDGHSTVEKLINIKLKSLMHTRSINIKKDDFRIDNRLKRYKINRDTILPNKKYFSLLDNCNLSSGGEAHDALDKMDYSNKKLAINIARDMGLRYLGLDIIVQNDISKPFNKKNNNYFVIEINAAPGVNHYAESGKKQKRTVYEIYRKILKALAK